MRKKKVPLRTCVGCQVTRPKREMVRVVRTPRGDVEIDPTGKKSGRGAYVCPQVACLENALKGRRLERSLSCQVNPEVVEKLREELVKQGGRPG